MTQASRLTLGPGTAHNPNRNSKIEVDGVQISGEMLWLKSVPFPVGTLLFLTDTGVIDDDPHILSTSPPEVQLLGRVVKGGYIYVTPKRLPVLT